MSNSFPPLVKICFLLILSGSCCAGAGDQALSAQNRMQGGEVIPADDYIERAKDLIRKLYPDLNHDLMPSIFEDMPWWVATSTNAFSIRWASYSPLPGQRDGRPCDFAEKLLLMGHFMFANARKDKQLMMFSVLDPTSQARQEGLGVLVRGHVEWSDEQVVQAFKKSGGKYGPGDKRLLLLALPVAELKPYIGELRVRSAEWVLHRPRKLGTRALDEVGLVCFWRVFGTSRLPSGAHADYEIVVDAFDGKISSLVERSFESR